MLLVICKEIPLNKMFQNNPLRVLLVPGALILGALLSRQNHARERLVAKVQIGPSVHDCNALIPAAVVDHRYVTDKDKW